MKKISIIGGNGKVGRRAIKNIFKDLPDSIKLKLVLVGSGSEESLNKLKGFLMDLEASLSLQNIYKDNIKVDITNDYRAIQDSNIVIISVGKWASLKEREKFKKIDPTGRLIQSFSNKELIEDISQKILENTPNSLIAIITNQVDMMAEVVRRNVNKNQTVLGIGGTVDSARFKLILYKKLKDLSQFRDIKLNEIDCHMIGYHNSDMIPLMDSIRLKGEKIQNKICMLNDILKETKNYSGEVSKLQKNSKYPEIDTGSSLLPSVAISQLILAFISNNRILKGSFNIKIKDKRIAHIYGIEANSVLSVPLKITNGKINFIDSYQVLITEKQKIKIMQEGLKSQIDKLYEKKKSRNLIF